LLICCATAAVSLQPFIPESLLSKAVAAVLIPAASDLINSSFKAI
jgi:hypothetical protein